MPSRSEWENRFKSWAAPPSETEAQKIDNTEPAIRRAIEKSAKLNTKDIRVFVQGSYRNNVNVRQESDVDIGVVCSKEAPLPRGRSPLPPKVMLPE